MAVIYGINQMRVTGLLATGAADPSAVAVTHDKPQNMNITPAYIDGVESILRGGDDIVAVVKNIDKFLGVDLTVSAATFDEDFTAVVVGGTASTDKWEAPTSTSEEPYPFKLEVWCKNYGESDSESTQDGFIKFTFPFCKGRLGSTNPADENFAVEEFQIRARRNDSDPSDLGPAITKEKVSTIS
jgi:hypothetical protein